MGTGDLCRVPLAAVHHGRARQNSVTGLCGYFRRVLWVPDPAGQYSGKIRFTKPQRVDGDRRSVPGAPSSGTPRESQAKFREGTV